jgi:hypothetical protein
MFRSGHRLFARPLAMAARGGIGVDGAPLGRELVDHVGDVQRGSMDLVSLTVTAGVGTSPTSAVSPPGSLVY